MRDNSDKKKNKQKPVSGELLEKEIQHVAKDLPPEEIKGIVRVVTTEIKRELWEGPLPPPGVFKQYPKEVQVAIIRQADAQMKHRHKIERTVVQSNARNSTRGMTLAFLLTLAMIIAGTILVGLGHSTAGLVAIFGTGGFQGGNYVLQKWREMQQASKRSKQQNNENLEEELDDEQTPPQAPD